jgi:hypothetical protein
MPKKPVKKKVMPSNTKEARVSASEKARFYPARPRINC